MIYINKHTVKKIINWLIIIIYLAIIFTFSNQNGIQSNQISKEIVKEVKETVPFTHTIQKNLHFEKPDWNYILRKTAHFTEYLILAFLFFRALIYCRVRAKKSFIIVLALCILYALLDEFHQTFVMGRTPRITDVMIDISGAVLALILLYFKKVIKVKFHTFYKKLF